MMTTGPRGGQGALEEGRSRRRRGKRRRRRTTTTTTTTTGLRRVSCFYNHSHYYHKAENDARNQEQPNNESSFHTDTEILYHSYTGVCQWQRCSNTITVSSKLSQFTADTYVSSDHQIRTCVFARFEEGSGFGNSFYRIWVVLRQQIYNHHHHHRNNNRY